MLNSGDVDYSCPICLELLLRPVVLSCHHRFCRGCWLRVLQGSEVRATANLTGSVACPFRCEVRPVVPEVSLELTRELESLFDVDLSLRDSAYALPEEERRVTEVNAWAAAGCTLEEATRAESAADLGPTAMLAAQADRERFGAQQLQQALTTLTARASMVLCFAVGLLLFLMAIARVHEDVQASKVTRAAMRALVALSVGWHANVVLAGTASAAARHAGRASPGCTTHSIL